MFTLFYGDRWDRYSLFVPNRYLLSCVSAGRDARTVITKDWEGWGPDNSRFIELPQHVNSRWMRSVALFSV